MAYCNSDCCDSFRASAPAVLQLLLPLLTKHYHYHAHHHGGGGDAGGGGAAAAAATEVAGGFGRTALNGSWTSDLGT